MKKNSIRMRKIHRDCWNLDNAFLVWLKEHLPVYLNDAGKVVNLDYYTFDYKGEKKTQKEMIEILISLVNKAIALDSYEDEYITTVNEIFDIWKLIFHCMWW